jgi:glycerol-3-phosphate O-acyltransferase/dihydroxyacetone phosphate acyltransferase
MLAFFYRRIEIVGQDNVPSDGPALFCGNHRNSIVDPMLLIAHSGRVVRFAAADIIFENPVLRFFLNAVGAVPIRRRQDHGGTTVEKVDNSAAFDALSAVLNKGGAMGIFPEGISHEESQLAPFKTGPARLALAAGAHGPDSQVRIIPCGLYYTNPGRYRSSAVLRFGPPIIIDDERLARWREDERAEVARLTADLDDGIRALTINADNWETVRILDGVRRLYQPPGIPLASRVELAHRFNKVYPLVSDSPDVAELLERTREYLDWLEALGLKDSDLSTKLSLKQRIQRGFHHFIQLAIALPLALVGAPIHAPLFFFLRWGGQRFAPPVSKCRITMIMLT